MSQLLKIFLFSTSLLLLLLLTLPPASSGDSNITLSKSSFQNLRAAADRIHKLASLISASSPPIPSINPLLSSAIHDCLDLLDLSANELAWTLAASGSELVKGPATGDRRFDLHSWLSAAVGNQETCKESLGSASSQVAALAADGLRTITALISTSLREVAASKPPGRNGGARARRLLELPEWVSAEDRRLLQAPEVEGADAVVAKDSSGDFRSIAAAVEAAPSQSESRYVIYVKKGVYKEIVVVEKDKWNLMLVGDGMDETIITGKRNVAAGWTTYRSATLSVNGQGFIARDLTVQNTAGSSGYQAVALRSDSDLSVFYRCGLHGHQDTVYSHSLRHFYRECRITGTVDYIFGNAAAVFQNCTILSRLPLPGQKNTITAHGRLDPNQNTGFSFQFCNVSADADLAKSIDSVATYLGRPWKDFSRTIFMKTYMDESIWPAGWLEWNGRESGLDTLYYAEYGNTGPGAAVEGRVRWPGYHFLSEEEATNFTVAEFIEGNLWLPATGVQYTAGLQM